MLATLWLNAIVLVCHWNLHCICIGWIWFCIHHLHRIVENKHIQRVPQLLMFVEAYSLRIQNRSKNMRNLLSYQTLYTHIHNINGGFKADILHNYQQKGVHVNKPKQLVTMSVKPHILNYYEIILWNTTQSDPDTVFYTVKRVIFLTKKNLNSMLHWPGYGFIKTRCD